MVRSAKQKGSNAERELVEMFHKASYSAVRVAGSGSMKFPAVDVIAGNGKDIIAVECKSTKGKHQYLKADQINQLLEVSQKLGAKPVIGIKFGTGWLFMNISDFKRTPSGEYVISKKTALVIGKNFEELTGDSD